jgi:hypothetical protein
MAIDLQLAEPFTPAEERPLTIRPEAIDAAYVVDGLAPDVDARLVEIDTSPQRRGPRRYLLTGLPPAVAALGRLRVRLWNGDPADDQRRLTEIAEAALAPVPADLREADELAALHR